MLLVLLECNQTELRIHDVDKMATVFFCSACGDTERVQSCSCRQKVNNSSVDGVHMYNLLESVLANKVDKEVFSWI